MGQLKKIIPKPTRNKIVDVAEKFLPEHSLRRRHFANAISIGGAGLVAAGAVLDTKGYEKSGMLLRGVGEAADDFDGDTARRLKTDGKLGATIDAVLDKIKVAVEVGLLWKHTQSMGEQEASIRKGRLGFIAGKHATNAALNTYITVRGVEAHSSQMGQANMWADGLAIGCWGIADASESRAVRNTANAVGNIAFGAGIVTGVLSTYGYLEQALHVNDQLEAQASVQTVQL